MSPVLVQTPVLSVNGTPLPARWLNGLTHLRIERALGLVGRATLRFSDPGYGLSAGNLFSLGTEVVVKLSSGENLITAEVTGVSLDQSESGPPDLVVTAHDLAYRLTRGTQVRTFSQVTLADVVGSLAREVGMSAQVVSVPGQIPYVIQNGTALSLLDDLTVRSGLLWWVQAKQLTVVKASGDPTTTVEVELGSSLTEFSVRASGLRPDVVSVSGWDTTTKQSLAGRSTAPTGSRSDFVADYAAPGRKLNGTATVAAADQLPSAAADADLLATSLLADWAAAAVVSRGSGEANADLAPGVAVRVGNAGPTTGTYRVSSVEHVYSQHGFSTRFTTGPNRPQGLVDNLGGAAARPAGTGSFSVGGLLVGVVTNIHDPDGWGRVRVRYPGIGGEVESHWARVLSVGAGPSRGVLFHPEVEDEVLVGFEHGDPRHPVVLGGLYSSKSVPPWKPESGANQVDQRRVSSRLGHFIELGDGTEPAKQHLLLQLGSGHKLRLGADRFDIELAAGKPMSIKAGSAKLEFDAQGNITLEGNAITLKANQAVSIEGLEVGLKAKSKASVEGVTVAVKGTASTSVEASGALALKGGMVNIN